MTINSQYEDLLYEVFHDGLDKTDRTGTGTRSLFGKQMRFDLSQGFPLITTKKMFTKGMIAELLWFISGSTNETVLAEQGVNWWKPWAAEDGELGPIYGKQFRKQSSFHTVKPRLYDPAPTDAPLPELPSTLASGANGVRNLNERTVHGVGYYGAYDKADPLYEMLVSIWRDMMKRCYDSTSKGYPSYGGAGVHVSERWQSFANFQSDFRRIPNWEQKLEYPSEFSLDKDTRYASNRYDVETCMWASEAVQNANRSNTRHFTATDPQGQTQAVTSIGSIKREHGLNVSAVHRCLNGKLKTHHGWSEFQYVDVPDGYVSRYNEIDQLKAVIATLKHNPDSRRHNIALWNSAELPWMELPPCHGNLMQFYVRGDKLDLQMYQRSADMFLGVPVNIASYALLLTMVADHTGYEPGEFVWTGGDCHIYDNHIEQVSEQLSRPVRFFPVLELTPAPTIDDYTPEHIHLVGYVPHPAIRAEVAV